MLQRAAATASLLILEEIAEQVQRLTVLVERHVAVDVHGHLDRGVAGNVHGRPWRDAEVQEHRDAAVSEVVQAHSAKAGPEACRLHDVRAVARVDGVSRSGS